MADAPDIEIVVRDAVGAETDITEAVRILYDTVHASMDWGSGFLDADEVGHIAALADACGFAGLEEVVEEYPVPVMYNTPGATYEERSATQRAAFLDRAKNARAAFRSIPKVRP